MNVPKKERSESLYLRAVPPYPTAGSNRDRREVLSPKPPLLTSFKRFVFFDPGRKARPHQ